MVLAGVLVAGAAAAQSADRSEAAAGDAVLLENVMPAADFRDLVLAAGGRVDFVFEDDRPFDACHASTLAALPGGRLVCAWFAGTKEGAGDVAIWLSRFEGTWSVPERVAKVNETAHWNPVLFTPGDGRLYLFFKVGPEIAEWQTWWMTSEDGGVSWSRPVELVSGDRGGRGPVRTKPIVLSDRAWLAGASTEKGTWRPFADRSEDAGRTWRRSAGFAFDRRSIKVSGGIQPALWESSPGHVHALMRTAAGVIVRSDSTDGGRTWSPVRRTPLPNNNSGIDVLKRGDLLYLVLNPVRQNWGPRTPLSLAVSADNGETWRILAHLEADSKAEAEYSYPAVVGMPDGVAISYTWNRQRIRVWQVPDTVLYAASSG